MNLYTIIMVEPRCKIPDGAVAGGEIMLAMGGLPKGETDGPWRKDQSVLVSQAVKKWYENAPANVTALHRQQRGYALDKLKSHDYSFIFEFHTGDDINLDCYQNDTSALYRALVDACVDGDMVATKFDSI